MSTQCGKVTAAVTGSLTLGIDPDETGLEKSSVPGEGHRCQNVPDQTIDGLCYFVRGGGTVTRAEAKTRCADDGYRIAPVRTAADAELIAGLIGDDVAFVGLDRDASTGAVTNAAADALDVDVDAYTAWAPGHPSAGAVYVKMDRNARMRGLGPGGIGTTVVCAANAFDTIGGTQLAVIVQPHVAAGLEGVLGVTWDGTINLDTALTITLELLDIALPFTTSVDVEYLQGGGVRLTVGQSIDIALSALEGSMTFDLEWKVCTKILGFKKCSRGTHSKTVATWDGIEVATWNLLDEVLATITF